MSINNKEVLEIMESINKKLVHYCLICGVDCRENVCIDCDSKADARKTLYYCHREVKKLDERMLPNTVKEYKKKQLIENANLKINYTNLDCYTPQEQQQCHESYWKEINKLLNDSNYFDLVYKTDKNYNVMLQPQYILENLRGENILNICLGCSGYPCRYTKDSNFNLKIIKSCAETKRKL